MDKLKDYEEFLQRFWQHAIEPHEVDSVVFAQWQQQAGLLLKKYGGDQGAERFSNIAEIR